VSEPWITKGHDHEVFPLPPPFLENPSRRHEGQEANQKGIGHHGGDEAVSVVDEHETAVQAEIWLRIGGRTVGTEWTAEAGRVFGGDRDSGSGRCDDGGSCVG